MRLAAIVIAAWFLLASAVAFGVILGLAIAPRVSAATLRPATVIPAAPSLPIASWAPSVSVTRPTAEPDQWRTGAPPDGVAATARPAARPPGMARHAAKGWDVAAAAAAGIGEPLQTISGLASWYSTGGPGIYAAAGPALRHGDWRGSLVTVCTGKRCLAVPLVDWCLCIVGGSERIVDLSLGAVRALGLDPAAGLFPVSAK